MGMDNINQQNPNVSKFIKNLYKIVSDDSINEIKWNQNGDGIIILDRDNFVKNILPLLSKTREYSSFVRQLNYYGFNKTKGLYEEGDEYISPHFRMNREDYLIHIKRENGKQKNTEIEKYKNDSEKLTQDLDTLNSNNIELRNQIHQVMKKLEQNDNVLRQVVEVFSNIFRIEPCKENPGYKVVLEPKEIKALCTLKQYISDYHLKSNSSLKVESSEDSSNKLLINKKNINYLENKASRERKYSRKDLGRTIWK